MAQLTLFNSLKREKQAFIPIDPQHVRLYACGPTVYSYAHIGNARMAVVFDLLARVLRGIYPKLTYVSNITDVDDKIITASRENGEDIHVLTRKYERIYNEDMKALGANPPDIQPRATDHIGDMVALIETLIAQDHAYAADGHVLFHVPSFPAYGGLSGRSRDEQVAGARVEVASYKKDPADFVLWKPSEPSEPGWDSPWGRGRPGWHIECSAMAERHLGLPFDIHGGGADLKFPHHENEIAQSCCAHGHENDLGAFAGYWVHNGFVTVEGEKMSKSLGNFLLVHDLLAEYPGEALRLTLLSAHYRQPLDWRADTIRQNKKLLDRLYKKLEGFDGPAGAVPDSVLRALYDDLNTPQMIAALNVLAKEDDLAGLKAAGDFLGILQEDPLLWKQGVQGHAGSSAPEGAESVAAIEALIAARDSAKKQKNFAQADKIRDELSALGVVVEDTPQGPVWRRV
ncbi:MAG: cysteine--tRNA ligase [Alphaproteobacteria bacterium]|nr:cysteine--tRNA ligase [Alphaproteobacteria bacterium]